MQTRHLGTWIFGCIIGLLPLIAWLFAHYLTGGRGLAGPSATRELLFLALSTSSTGLLSLSEDPHPKWSHLWTSGLVLTIFSALFYGEFLIGEALHAAIQVRSAYNISRVFAAAALIYGGVVEGITHRSSAK
jgi:hypothetical protein